MSCVPAGAFLGLREAPGAPFPSSEVISCVRGDVGTQLILTVWSADSLCFLRLQLLSRIDRERIQPAGHRACVFPCW